MGARDGVAGVEGLTMVLGERSVTIVRGPLEGSMCGQSFVK